MNNLYQALDEVLVRKIKLYDEIIEVIREEWNSITEYNRKNLETALERKETLLVKVHELNNTREGLVQSIAKSIHHNQGRLGLKDIIQIKDNLWAPRMVESRKTIRERIQTIQEMNQANRALIGRTAEGIKASMGWLYQADAAYTPYFSNGQLREPPMESQVVNTDA